MRFKTDENLPVEIAELLRQQGQDALTVGEEGLVGVTDPAVAAVCQVEKRAIVTLNLDFSDIRRYPPENYAGIIVLASRRTTDSDSGAVDGARHRSSRSRAT